MAALTGSITIDIDTGGTFTDGTISDGNQVLGLKVLTTPHDLTICFHNLIKAASAEFGVTEAELLKQVESIRYSTTIGTNTIIQRNGPRVGLLVLGKDAARFSALDGSSLLGDILTPTAAKVRGIELGGTVESGRILEAVEYLLGEGAERLVVSMSDDARAIESEIKQIVFTEYPRHILGALPILFSTELSDDPDIMRRTATAVLNAYLHPSLEHFLYNSEDILRSYRYSRPLFIFGNDGTSNRVAKVTALKTYNSGPTGGLEGALSLARHYGLPRAISLDIGGTSTDVAVLVDGQLEADPYGNIEGVTLSLPLRKIHALGGGGGTIARVVNGDFRLGPDSAGASPGPACFGFGGTEATVTDANLVTGLFQDGAVLAGQVTVDGARALNAITERIARPMGMTAEAAAVLVRETLEERIGVMIRSEVKRRGMEPADFTLLAFGGAGPLHAAGIAARAGIKQVLIPDMCSVFSAFGIGFSDVAHRYSRTVSPAGLQEAVAAMTERARIDMRGEGFARDRLALNWDLRLMAGSEEVDAVTDPIAARALLDEKPKVTTVEIRLEVLGQLPHLGLPERSRPTAPPVPVTRRPVLWTAGRTTETPVYSMSDLDGTHASADGPAVVAGTNTTIAVPPGWRLSRDAFDQYFLTEVQ